MKKRTKEEVVKIVKQEEPETPAQPTKAEKEPKIISQPVSYQEHLDAGFVELEGSEHQQKSGDKVVEIKVVDGKTLHRMEK